MLRKNLLILIGLLLGHWTFAQEATPPAPPGEGKVHELGVGFGSLDGFYSMHYRVGKARALWSFNSAFLGGQLSGSRFDTSKVSTKGVALMINVGREYRKSIIEQLEFRTGFNIGMSFGFGSFRRVDNAVLNQSVKNLEIHPTAGAFMGVNYVIKECLVLGAAVGAGLSYELKRNVDGIDANAVSTNVHGFGLSIRNNAGLSIGFRF